MNRLSVLVITLNEEEKLPKCLNSVKDIADEIILVDSGSSDNTIEIAKKYGAKIFFRKFDNYANQKNFAIGKATGEWLLSLDADEEIETGLSSEISSIVKDRSTEKYFGFSMPRKNIILGKFIKYSRWQPELDRHIWLWMKGKANWTGDVHEEIEVDGQVGKLKFAKVHYQYNTVKEFFAMMNSYSELEAKQKTKNGIKFSCFRLFYDPIYNFIVRFFYRLGFLDGWRGFILSYLMAIYHLILWVKVWGLTSGSKSTSL